jgi:hypothetical protein
MGALRMVAPLYNTMTNDPQAILPLRLSRPGRESHFHILFQLGKEADELVICTVTFILFV